MIQAGSDDAERFGELVDILLDSELPFKEASLGDGEWQVCFVAPLPLHILLCLCQNADGTAVYSIVPAKALLPKTSILLGPCSTPKSPLAGSCLLQCRHNCHISPSVRTSKALPLKLMRAALRLKTQHVAC